MECPGIWVGAEPLGLPWGELRRRRSGEALLVADKAPRFSTEVALRDSGRRKHERHERRRQQGRRSFRRVVGPTLRKRPNPTPENLAPRPPKSRQIEAFRRPGGPTKTPPVLGPALGPDLSSIRVADVVSFLRCGRQVERARRAGGPATLLPPRRPSGRRACCFELLRPSASGQAMGQDPRRRPCVLGREPAAPLADSRGRGQVFAGMKKANARIHMPSASLAEIYPRTC